MTTLTRDDYMTRDEAARQIGVTRQTMAVWASTRRGPPYIKLGGRYLYGRTALARWIERNKGGAAC